MPQDDKNNNEDFNFNFNNNRTALIFLGMLILFFMFYFSFSAQTELNEIPYSMFLQYVNKGMIYDVQILDQSEILGRYVNTSDSGKVGLSFKTTIPYYDDNLMSLLIDKGVSIRGGGQCCFAGCCPFADAALGYQLSLYLVDVQECSGRRLQGLQLRKE